MRSGRALIWAFLFLASQFMPHSRFLDPGGGSQCSGSSPAAGSSPAYMRRHISFAMPDPIQGQSATCLRTGRFKNSRRAMPAVPCLYPAVLAARARARRSMPWCPTSLPVRDVRWSGALKAIIRRCLISCNRRCLIFLWCTADALSADGLRSRPPPQRSPGVRLAGPPHRLSATKAPLARWPSRLRRPRPHR